MNASYLTFRLFGWTPRTYYAMDDGERTVVRAFLSQYAQDQKEELEGLKNGAKGH